LTKAQRYTKELRRKAARGPAGCPVAVIAYFGPEDQIAAKVAVFILSDEAFNMAGITTIKQ
jgi:hypothetical protein